MDTFLRTILSENEQTKSVTQSRKRHKEPGKSEESKKTNGQKLIKNEAKKAKETEESTKDLDAADLAFNSMIAGNGAHHDLICSYDYFL